jgi:hypothetical protein
LLKNLFASFFHSSCHKLYMGKLPNFHLIRSLFI